MQSVAFFCDALWVGFVKKIKIKNKNCITLLILPSRFGFAGITWSSGWAVLHRWWAWSFPLPMQRPLTPLITLSCWRRRTDVKLLPLCVCVCALATFVAATGGASSEVRCISCCQACWKVEDGLLARLGSGYGNQLAWKNYYYLSEMFPLQTFMKNDFPFSRFASFLLFE